MFDPTNPITARALLEDALALSSKPTLTTQQVNRAFALASSLDTDGVTVLYTMADLNRSAAWGWTVKQGLTADKYELGGGAGKVLKPNQWYDHCREMAGAYGSGLRSVDGSTGTGVTVGQVVTMRYDFLTAGDAYEQWL